MCGILAVFGNNINQDLALEQGKKMAHRGPDDYGYQAIASGLLAQYRLSIMGGQDGKQPIQGAGSTWVIHNGEVYNYQQLIRDELAGVTLRTHSDSEVIVHLYEKYGYQFLNHLDGIYAFVVADEQTGRYIAGRDPIGVKPLYYGTDAQGNIWFASEMKVLADICISFQVFPPGHFYTPETGIVRYYYPEWERKLPTKEVDLRLEASLCAVVEKQLDCHVPYGCLLSGGLDSSLIAAIAARKLAETGEKLHTFSIGVHENVPDLIAARRVADFIGSIHHEFHFTETEGIAAVDKLIWHLESYDVTTIRASVPMYLLSKKITEMGFKMVLSGEGADELFGGYLYFHEAPDDISFEYELKRRLRLLYTADVLRADKATMAFGLEARVPFLDRDFIQTAMSISPGLKRPVLHGRMEKAVLRSAFDCAENPYLPEEVLWRRKEQFSDGVGYSWIDSFQEFCNKQVTDTEMALAENMYPLNTPKTKEGLYIRRVFHRFYPQHDAAQTVRIRYLAWQKSQDPSGRSSIAHQSMNAFAKT
jgi:asparagine synthase (glutamine-hydrolysing)